MATKTKEEAQKEAQDKVKYEGFYGKNTVEIKSGPLKGRRVNKFEAEALEKKFKK